MSTVRHTEYASAPEIIARRLLKQAEWCRKLGSPMYSKLLQCAADDARSRGPCWEVLRERHADPPGSALALSFKSAFAVPHFKKLVNLLSFSRHHRLDS